MTGSPDFDKIREYSHDQQLDYLAAQLQAHPDLATITAINHLVRGIAEEIRAGSRGPARYRRKPLPPMRAGSYEVHSHVLYPGTVMQILDQMRKASIPLDAHIAPGYEYEDMIIEAEWLTRKS